MRIRMTLLAWIAAIGIVPLPSHAAGSTPPQRTIEGREGRASVHAEASFSETARRDATSPKRTKPERTQGRAPRRSGTYPAPANAPGPASPSAGSPLVPSPASSMSFKAIDNTTGTGDTIPPDTMGAVGPNHLFVVTNQDVAVQSRTGTQLSRQSLDNFWSPLFPGGGFVTFDPKVVYDPYSAHFIFTSVANPDSGASALLVAISDSSDPGGTWNLFGVDADQSNTMWADFPGLGFTRDWVVVHINMFLVGSEDYDHSEVYVFRKGKMLSGTLSGLYKLFSDEGVPLSQRGFAQAPAETYNSTLNTMYLVENWDGEANNGTLGVLRMSKVTGPVGAEVYTTNIFVTAAAPWDNGIGGPEFAPQSGDTRGIDAGDARIGNCVYRNGSLWCVQTVFLPSGTPTRTSVQWWQISVTGAVLQRARIDDADGIAPQNFYAFPSIAANANSDVMIGYAHFSSDIFASASYSMRLGTDSANTLRDPRDVKLGEATYNKDLGSGVNRWGDFSHTVVDPLNDADLWTIQEYADTHDDQDRSRWALWWARVASASFAVPTLVDGVTARFASDVDGVSYGDNFTVTLTGGLTSLPGAVTCRNASGAVLGTCATGVRSVNWKPPAPLTPGQKYTAKINPDGASTPITVSTSGGPVDVAPATLNFRSSTVEQETSFAAGPRWRTANSAAAYGGSYLVDHLGGARVHFKFNAPVRTQVSWYSLLGPSQGQAQVYIDNVLIRTYNNYASSFIYRYRRSFTINAGNHVFSVIVRGLKGATAGTDTQVTVDAFAIGGTLYTTPATCGSPLATNNCTLQQWRIAGASGASGGTYAIGNLGGATFYFIFRGTGLDAYGVKGPSFGRGAVYIDGLYKGTIDFYAASTQFGYRMSYRGLSDTVHTWRIIISGTRNPSSSGTNVGLDRWVVV